MQDTRGIQHRNVVLYSRREERTGLGTRGWLLELPVTHLEHPYFPWPRFELCRLRRLGFCLETASDSLDYKLPFHLDTSM